MEHIDHTTLRLAFERIDEALARPQMACVIDRDTWLTGSRMLRAMLRDDLVVARAIRERRYRDLHAVAVAADAGVDHRLAATDPVAYKAIRDGITLYHLKGYRCLDVEALDRLAKRQEARAGRSPIQAIGARKLNRTQERSRRLTASRWTAKRRGSTPHLPNAIPRSVVQVPPVRKGHTMKGSNELPQTQRHALAQRYASGELSIQDVRSAGHWRFLGLLADLADLGLRPPHADMAGPNVETRRAGIARLESVIHG